MINLISFSGLVVVAHVRVDRQYRTVWEKRPTFFVVNIFLALACGRPTQRRGIKQSGIGSAAASLHIGAIGQNNALCIADVVPTGRRGYRSPLIRLRIIDCTLVGPD